MPKARTASAVCSPTQATFTPAKARASRPSSANFSRTALTALTEVKTIQPYRPVTRPLMARSICAGLRGGSTAMVGTSTGTAPWARSRSLISPAWSLVRGTSTRHPNSGRLSHQDSRARLSTADPTVATTGPLTASRPAVFSATAASRATTLRCPVPEPPVVTTTGVEPDRPPSTSRAAASGRSSALPCSTSGASRLFTAAASAARSASPPRRSADSEVLPSATPAKAGTAVVEATPGTTSKPTEVRPTASTSLTTSSEVNGSPATSRTTVPPDLAAATAALATSAGSPVAGVSSSSGRSARTASVTAGATSGSTRTVCASASAAVARAVSIPGSPGPAPTKTTLPAAPFLRVMSCSWFWPRRARVRGCGGSGPAARPRGCGSPGGRHELGGAPVEELRGELTAEPLSLGGRPGDRAADAVAAVECGDRGAEEQFGAVLPLGEFGVRGDRSAAAGLQRGQRRPLRDDAGAGAGVVEGGEQLPGAPVVAAALDGQGALRRCGQDLQRVEG